MTAALVAMDDARFILGAYAITLVVIGTYSWRVVRHGRRLGRRVPDADKHWTRSTRAR